MEAGPSNGNSQGQDSPGTESVQLGDRHDHHDQCEFQPWSMIGLFSLHWIAAWIITIGGVILIMKPLNADSPCHMYFIMVYLRAGFWIGTYTLNERIKKPCRSLMDRNYDLYEKLKLYRKAPLMIVSFWNTILIAINSYVRSFFENFRGEPGEAGACKPIKNEIIDALQSPQEVIVIICAIETISLSCFYVPAFVRLIRTSWAVPISHELSKNQKLHMQAEKMKTLLKTNADLKKKITKLTAGNQPLTVDA